MSSKRQTNLYHCTKSDSLLKILESKYFKYSYCLEEYYLHKEGRYILEKLAYAMVCFADMLEEEVSGHMEQFRADCYIVMDKKWAVKNNLSPVIYYSKDGLPNYAYLSLTKNIRGLIEKSTEEEIIVVNSIELLRPYFKQYFGHYFINGTEEKSKEEVEFFLEREWRSVPFVTGGERYFLDLKDYLNGDIRSNASQELLDHNYCLRFEWDDIKQIGCKKGGKEKIIKTIMDSFRIDEKEAKTKIVSVNFDDDKRSNNV